MKKADNLPLITSAQDTFLANGKADAIWCELCDNFLIGEHFTVNEAIARSTILADHAPRTAYNYMRVILTNVIMDQQQRPVEYDGMVPVRLVGHKHHSKLYSL